MANILVVDDELGMRQFLTHLLQREGHVVRVAENGREALDLLREQAPDLIISDIRMPDMDGVDLLRAARELLPEVEVIMMTAFANVDTAREAFLLGAYDFVQKPFDNDLLKETVARALAKISLLKEKEALLERITREVMAAYPGSSHTFTVKEQYRNMKVVLDRHPQVIAYALEAIRRAGLTPRRSSIRGGTHGSRLSFMGLPCPNISAGEHAFPARLYWVSGQDMHKAAATIVHLAMIWEEHA